MTHIPSLALATEIGVQIGALTFGTNGVLVHDTAVTGDFVTSGAIQETEIAAALAIIQDADAVTNATAERGIILILDSNAAADGVDVAAFYIDHAASGTAVTAAEIQLIGVFENYGATITDGLVL